MNKAHLIEVGQALARPPGPAAAPCYSAALYRAMQIATAEPLRRWAFRLLFAAVLLLAAFLRMRGLEYGVPYPRHHRPDEEQIVDQALHMVASHDLEPGELNYPDLFKYLGAAALFASYQAGRLTGRYVAIKDFLFDVRVTRAGRHYVVCRAVSAAIGVGTVLLVALLARELGGSAPAALLAAAFLGTSFLHVRDSHFATVDVTTTFFATLSLYFAVRAWDRAGKAMLVLSGLAAGMAAATKYNAGLVLVGGLTACGSSYPGEDPRGRGSALLGRVGLLAAAALTGFAAATPYTFLHLRDVFATLAHIQDVLVSRPGPPALLVHATTTLPAGLGWPVFAAALVGLAGTVADPRRPHLVLAVFTGVFFASIAVTTWVMPRYVLPLLPPLCVLAGDMVWRAARSARREWLAVPVGLACAAPGAVRSAELTRIMSRKDTRVLAADWVTANVPSTTRIAACRGYGAPDLPALPRQFPFYKVSEPRCTPELAAPASARYLVTHEHPFLPWSPPPGHYDFLPAAGWQLRAAFDPFTSTPPQPAGYFTGDAFYMPYDHLATIQRGGPIVRIWERAD